VVLFLLLLALPALYCLWTHLATALWDRRVESMLSGPGLRALVREIRLQYLLVILGLREPLASTRQLDRSEAHGPGPVVVLLPGFTESPALFGPLRKALVGAGCRCLDYRYDTMRADPVREAARLRTYLEDLEIGSSARVFLVGHSLGALLASGALESGSGRSRPLVALATPWRGTRVARLALAPYGRHLRPVSPFIAGVRIPTGRDVLNIRSLHDNLLVPGETAVLEDTEEMVVSDGWGHNGLVRHRLVIQRIVDWILRHD